MTTDPTRHMALYLSLIGIIVEFLLSGRVMAALGVPYSDEGGPLIAKLHPGTYLSAFAVAARFASNTRPLAEAWRLAWREPALAFYLCAMLFCLICEFLFTGTGGIILLVDVFLPAGLFGIAVAELTSSEAACLTRLLRLLFILNAGMALTEAIVGAHILPTADTSESPDTVMTLHPGAEFRPVALYDHPLTGGAATLIGLMLAPDRRRAPLWCTAYTLCMFVSLLTFGGRIAVVVTLCAGIWLYANRIAQRAKVGSVAAADIAPLVAVIVLGLPLAGLAVANGLASRLLAHLYWDASAQTRVAEFHLLGLLRPEQLLFGCRRSDMIALLTPMNLAYGVDAIENFWLVMLVMLGALGFPAFVVGMASLSRWLWNRGDAAARVMVVCFFLVTSSSNSLGHKSPLLVMLVATVMARSHVAPQRRSCLPVYGVGSSVIAVRT